MTVPFTAPPAHSFAASFARAGHWGFAAKACLEGLAGHRGTLGILYATERFNQNLSSILTFLRETTRIEHWVGAVVPGLMGNDQTESDEGALAVMTANLPETSFQVFSGLDVAATMARHADWLAAHGPVLGLVHGDPRSPGLPTLLAAAAEQAGFLVGGLVSTSGPPAQVADLVVSGGLSGLLLSRDIPVVTGLTHGCTPLGPPHLVTESNQGVLISLDGRPAVSVLKEEAGELIARDLRRAAGYIHVGLPVAGSDIRGYVVRNLLGIDPGQGSLSVGDHVEIGAKVMLVRRDPVAAQADMARMLADVTRRLDGREPLAAFYNSCIARGRHLFGSDEAELALIRSALGPVPLAGFFGLGEFCGERVHTYAGVLTVITKPTS